VLLARDPHDPRFWLADTSDDRGVAEVVNDLDGRITNFYEVLQDEHLFARLCRRVSHTPFSRRAWEAARTHRYGQDPVADAWAFFVTNRQSRQGLGRCFATPSLGRNRGGMDERTSAWLSAVAGLPEVALRLRRVVVENMPAVDLIPQEDGPETLFYCDPPYPHETRAAVSAYGNFEMTTADHRNLLKVLREVQGKVILSGYPCELYDEVLHDWTRRTREVANHASAEKTKDRETEVLWLNY
jgi:DNA adenine methylase